jgi:hypothetical protein
MRVNYRKGKNIKKWGQVFFSSYFPPFLRGGEVSFSIQKRKEKKDIVKASSSSSNVGIPDRP